MSVCVCVRDEPYIAISFPLVGMNVVVMFQYEATGVSWQRPNRLVHLCIDKAIIIAAVDTTHYYLCKIGSDLAVADN